MHKIIFLGVGGPLACARSAHMPNGLDPIAVDLVNRAAANGWQFVLSSDFRHQLGTVDEAYTWAASVGLNITQFFDEHGEGWRTTQDTLSRHLEIATWMQNNDVPADAIFLVIDDEYMPRLFMDRYRMNQLNANTTVGIDYLSLQDGLRWFAMTNSELEEEFALQDEGSK